ncbi:cysteine desulfurase [candidate division MSBL1 archaeon SCGC-AAA261C02]|uniref:cysteine desulfurase n=1 Tax=candidate division MSBL1 archaeon SCGC-AAA261C02 TaxID=1698272 RepID=A0A133V224_9EURY|nr:cysteine desulfurase [candidate division MSBL1 archaeon SCGC-AAA261C02]
MTKSVEEVRSEIPFLKTGIIYLDNAATTPTPRPVIDAMLEYFQEYNANIGRGLHRSAKRATEEFEAARGKIAETIGAKPGEIAYTKNATEALNMVANGLNLKKGDKVIATILEHHSNLVPWQRLERTRGIELEVVREAPDCVIDPAAIEDAVDDRTRLITMPHVSNALGTIQPVREVGEIAEEHDVLFSIDAAQAVGHMPIDVSEINCDFLAAPGHKGLMGPQGTGFLYVREDRQEELEPLLLGGGIVQTVTEHKCGLVEPPQVFDAGTPNIPGIIGLGKAAEYVLEIGLEEIEKREQKLTQEMLKISEIDSIEVYGPKNPEDRGGVVSFNLSGMDPHEASSILDEVANIATRSGHHCAMPVMSHLGIDGTVRASIHYYNTEDEVEKFVKTIKDITQELTD